jgi:hypothetical protein
MLSILRLTFAIKYIEGHTKYLSLETITTVVNNQPTTTTSEVKVAVETATAGNEDQAAGDIAVTFSKDVADALRTTADSAIQACGLTKRSLDKRLDCELSPHGQPSFHT